LDVDWRRSDEGRWRTQRSDHGDYAGRDREYPQKTGKGIKVPPPIPTLLRQGDLKA